MPSTRPVWALLPALLAAPSFAAERYSAEQFARQLSTVESQQARQRLATADATGLLLLIRQALTQRDADPLQSEAQAYRGLLRLREAGMPHDPAGRALLQSLLGYQAQALVPPADPDHGRGLWVPAYDLAAAARGTLAIWQSQEAEQAAWRALIDHDYARLRATEAQALAVVLAQATPALLQGLAGQGPWPDAPLGVLAARLGDPGLAGQLLAQASEAELLAALPNVSRGLPSADAQLWLQALAEQRPALASAALLTMGRLLPQQSPDYLLAQLDDPQRGSSAAQALAVVATPAVRAALIGILARNPDGPRLRRALLALHWMDDAAARTSLQAFVDRKSSPAALRSEVATWLR